MSREHQGDNGNRAIRKNTMERGSLKARIGKTDYYQNCVLHAGQEHSYDAIDSVCERKILSSSYGLSTGEDRDMKLHIAAIPSVVIDLSFRSGLIDLVSHRAVRRIMVFEWIVERTFEHRLERYINQLLSTGFFPYTKHIAIHNNGDVYYNGHLKGSLKGAWLSGITTPGWIQGTSTHNAYDIIVDPMNKPFKFEACWNRDVLSTLMSRLYKLGTFA